MTQKELGMAVCGLLCDECHLYRAGFDLAAAEALLPLFRERGWLPSGASATAQELMDQGPWCLGCHGDRQHHWSDQCSLMLCCLDLKRLNNCSECQAFVCQQLQDWAAQNERYAAALGRLQALKH